MASTLLGEIRIGIRSVEAVLFGGNVVLRGGHDFGRDSK